MTNSKGFTVSTPPFRPRALCIRLRTLFFFNDPAPSEIYTLSLHDALPILVGGGVVRGAVVGGGVLAVVLPLTGGGRSEEHTSELQSRLHLVCRLLLEKKNDGECLVALRH